MPTLFLPECEAATPRLLEHMSDGAVLNYYHCHGCSYVWTTEKNGTAVVSDIPPRTPPPLPPLKTNPS